MICTYNQTQKTWTTPFDEPVTFLCGDLALCEGHLYTRTVIKPREEYTLEPCTSDDLRAIMTEGLTSGSVVFSGSYTEAVEWIRRKVKTRVKAYREDFTIDLHNLSQLVCTDVGPVTYTLGLRECGVDGISFIRHRRAADYLKLYTIRVEDDFRLTTTIYAMNMEED